MAMLIAAVNFALGQDQFGPVVLDFAMAGGSSRVGKIVRDPTCLLRRFCIPQGTSTQTSYRLPLLEVLSERHARSEMCRQQSKFLSDRSAKRARPKLVSLRNPVRICIERCIQPSSLCEARRTREVKLPTPSAPSIDKRKLETHLEKRFRQARRLLGPHLLDSGRQMGICASCCEDTSDSLSPSRTGTRTEIHRTQINEPDSETKRQLQAEAAEKRLKELEGRGVTDPERLKRQQKKQEELDRARDQMPANQEGGLRWTTD